MFAQALPKTKLVPMFVFLLHAREPMLNKLYGYDLAINDRFGSFAVIQLQSFGIVYFSNKPDFRSAQNAVEKSGLSPIT